MSDRAKNVFTVRLDVAATPARVAEVAALFARMLAAASPNLPEGSATMIVENYSTKATLRTRTEIGHRAGAVLLNVLEKPGHPRARGDERAAAVAEALVDNADLLTPYRPRFFKPKARRHFAELNSELVERLREVATNPSVGRRVSGTTMVYSRVLRVGFTNERGDLKARLVLDGKPVDVTVASHAEEAFWDAARSKRRLPIRLRASWYRGLDDELFLEPRRCTAVGIDLAWRAASGADFVRDGLRTLPDAFADIDESLALIRGE